MNQTKGFSLIELVIAIAIMAGIMAMVVPALNQYRARAKKNTTQAIVKTVGNAIDMFHSDTGTYPATLQDLVTKPVDPKVAKRWQEGGYLSKPSFEDGYNQELVYQVTKGSKHPYELYSWGSTGEGSPEEEHISVWDL